MTFQLIFFIAAILLGILVYWKESKGNKTYRFINKIFYSKELQIEATNTKGFVYQQTFVLRLVFIALFFLLVLIVFQFVIPIGINMLSCIVPMISGTLIGTYIAHFIFKSTEIIEEQRENLEEIVQETLDKGKDFIEDVKEDVKEITEKKTIENKTKEVEGAPEKSARERLKDKGLL